MKKFGIKRNREKSIEQLITSLKRKGIHCFITPNNPYFPVFSKNTKWIYNGGFRKKGDYDWHNSLLQQVIDKGQVVLMGLCNIVNYPKKVRVDSSSVYFEVKKYLSEEERRKYLENYLLYGEKIYNCKKIN